MHGPLNVKHVLKSVRLSTLSFGRENWELVTGKRPVHWIHQCWTSLKQIWLKLMWESIFDLISVVRPFTCLLAIRVSSYLSLVCSDSFRFFAVCLFGYVDWLGGMMDDWRLLLYCKYYGKFGVFMWAGYHRHSNQNTCWSIGNSWFEALQGYEVFLFPKLSRLARLLTHHLATCTWRRSADSSSVLARNLTLTSL